MKNVKVKVIHYTCLKQYGYGIYQGKKQLFYKYDYKSWQTLEAAIRNAKAMAKRIGIKYDPEIIKQHGC
jgi:hypothetical protein